MKFIKKMDITDIHEKNEDLFKKEVELYFNDDFNDELFNSKLLIEDGIEKIIFGNKFNKPIGHFGYGSFLPKTLKILELSDNFNQSIDFLPDGLISLHFSKKSEFNQIITKLPVSLEILRFGDKFDKAILFLPPSLKILEFGNNFNQPLDPLIYPNKLFTISFGNLFNQYIDELPDSLENIKFGDNFNREFIFPRNLKYIEFGKAFDQSIVDKIPNNIRKIKICSNYQYKKQIIEKCEDIISIKKF